MTNNSLQKRDKHELSRDFRSAVTKLENDLRINADGVNIIVGSSDKPIVNDSKLIPIRHFFMDSVYIREMTMYKDTAVIGAVHKHLHMCFLLSGHVTVADEKGIKDYIAPCYVIATPGVKRVLYAHEDSVWYNTHKNPSNTEDIATVEENTVALNYKEYEEYIKNK